MAARIAVLRPVANAPASAASDRFAAELLANQRITFGGRRTRRAPRRAVARRVRVALRARRLDRRRARRIRRRPSRPCWPPRGSTATQTVERDGRQRTLAEWLTTGLEITRVTRPLLREIRGARPAPGARRAAATRPGSGIARALHGDPARGPARALPGDVAGRGAGRRAAPARAATLLDRLEREGSRRGSPPDRGPHRHRRRLAPAGRRLALPRRPCGRLDDSGLRRTEPPLPPARGRFARHHHDRRGHRGRAVPRICPGARRDRGARAQLAHSSARAISRATSSTSSSGSARRSAARSRASTSPSRAIRRARPTCSTGSRGRRRDSTTGSRAARHVYVCGDATRMAPDVHAALAGVDRNARRDPGRGRTRASRPARRRRPLPAGCLLMADASTSAVERIKAASRGLRGTIVESLADPVTGGPRRGRPAPAQVSRLLPAGRPRQRARRGGRPGSSPHTAS